MGLHVSAVHRARRRMRALAALATLALGVRAALAADATVSLVLFDQRQPLPDAEVRIDGQPRAKTNPDGVARLGLAPGPHTLTVVRGDHTVLTVELMVRAEESAEIIATLYPDAAPSVFIESSHGAAGQPGTGAPQAEGPPGVLEGQVLSAESGEPVAGARVYISGTPLDIRTDAQGRWRAELPAGSYSLSVIAADHASQTVDDLAVKSGHTAVHEIELTPAGLELAEFIVLEAFVEGSLAAFVEERRTSAAVTDILGAEQISRQGDSDAAGALRRVTGLTLVEGKYVYVRGLGERYSSVLLNGAQIPSPDPTRRVIPLDLFPTDVLSGVVIQKTYSAEMPGEFGGGTVQLRTRGVPDAPFLKLGLTTGYTEGASFQDGLGYGGGDRDYTGYDDGTRALPEPIAEAIAGGRFLRQRNPTNPDGLTPQQFEVLGEALAAGGYAVQPRRLGPDLGGSISGGHGFQFGDQGRWGFLGALRYGQSWDHREELRRSYRATATGDLRLADDDSVLETTRNLDLSGFMNLGLEWGDAHSVTLTSMLLHQAEDSTRVADGIEDTQLRQTYELKWIESELFSNQLRGEHALPWGGLAADWQYTDARASREEPNTRQYRRDDDDSNGSYTFSDRNSSNSQTFGELVDDAVNWDLALQYPMQLSGDTQLTLRGGIGLLERERDAAIRRFSFSVGRGIPRDLFELPQEALLSPPYIGPDGFSLVETTLGTDNYTASQRIAARFLTADLQVGDPWRLTAGLREEDNVQEVLTRSVSNPDQVIPARIDERNRLPSLALTWAYSGSAQFRAGYGRSLSRPDFRELSPAQFEDPLLDLITVGNPNLATTQIENYDLRWEHYFSPLESFSAAAFYKDFTNPIEKTFSSGGSAKIINLQNALAAEVYGIELDLYKDLGFIGSMGFVRNSFLDRIDWGRYHIGANYARIESSVEIDTRLTIQTNADRPLQGQSPYVANLQFGYSDPDGGSDWTLLYNVFGERIAQAGVSQQPDIYEQPVPQLDFVYRRPFGKHWDFKLRLRNLLDPEVEFTQGVEITRSFRRGRELALTIEWKPF
ncbi:MAG TPA: TonB-dependent receptor [Xanthomonadaceae bacterium]|nr:TonB-dependent receptor [Xanthomonadaceae bacterium]